MEVAIKLTTVCFLILVVNDGVFVLAETTYHEPTKGLDKSLISLMENPLKSHNKTNTMWNSTVNDALKRDLFANYNKFAHPLSFGKPTDIKIGVAVRHVVIDELQGKITVYGWIRMKWQDDKFKWSPWDYGSVSTMHVVPEEVWLPDLTLFNSAANHEDSFGSSQLIISQTGSFLWVPPAVFTAFCKLDLHLWPFDVQNCYLKMGSWSRADIKLELYAGKDDTVDVDTIVENNEWEVSKISTTFGTNEQFYNFVKFDFVLVRRAAIYKALILIPASCLVILVLSSFWIPPQMGEKLLLNGVVVVVIIAFLMYFAQLLPVLAQKTPLVVLFYSNSLLLVGIATLESVLVLYLSSAKHRQRVPTVLRNILTGPISAFLFLSHLRPDIDPQSSNQTEQTDQHSDGVSHFEDQQTMSAMTAKSIQFDWIVLATAIDRVMFVLYSLIFIVLAIAYSV